ncbi:MAG: hypothetical protein KBD83_01115 [Gammaproteobacteria bacterium]|nr:hypothetical protein [Gammaproteobacteria bacterium]
MNKKNINPQQLDAEEQDLLESFERDEWIESANLAEEMVFAKEAAANFLKKDARINIRLTQNDLKKIKQLAAYEGMPYQTLIASFLHKLAAGHLKLA